MMMRNYEMTRNPSHHAPRKPGSPSARPSLICKQLYSDSAVLMNKQFTVRMAIHASIMIIVMVLPLMAWVDDCDCDCAYMLNIDACDGFKPLMARVDIDAKRGRAKKKAEAWSKGSPGENQADHHNHNYDHDHHHKYDDQHHHNHVDCCCREMKMVDVETSTIVIDNV